MVADQVAHVAHLNARDTTLAFVSRAPQTDIERVKARMGWEMPWYTMTDGFDTDFGVDEWHGTNAFIRDGDRVFRTYFINTRGDEAMGSTWSYLDMTALGRQEEWEDSPEGYPQTPPYEWWNWHDEYGDARRSQWWIDRGEDELNPADPRPRHTPQGRRRHVIAHVAGVPVEEILLPLAERGGRRAAPGARLGCIAPGEMDNWKVMTEQTDLPPGDPRLYRQSRRRRSICVAFGRAGRFPPARAGAGPARDPPSC